MHGIRDGLFLIRRRLYPEFYRLRVVLFEVIAFLRDGPVGPAVEMFNHPHLHRRFLVVAELDLETLVDPVLLRVGLIPGSTALADYIKGIAGVEADGFIRRRVVESVFTGEFHLSVVIAAVEPGSAGGQ